MAAASTTRPRWQRGALFQFFSSIKLAVVLLAVLILGAIVGTISESSLDAKVARAYVYGAPWFNFWLVLLAANLTCSALSRWPWRKHHVAFLVTHLGIITLLAGSLIGRIWGIEGTMTLFKGEPPTSRLLTDEHQLRVSDADGIVKGYNAEFLHHPPTAAKPRDLGPLAQGARLAFVGYADEIDAKLAPQPLGEGGLPALHFQIKTALMSQQLESWLLADDPQNNQFAMGLAKIELKQGRANISAKTPTAAPASGETDLEESIFAFAKAPENQISHVAKGGSTGAKVSLSPPTGNDKGTLTISLGGKAQMIDVASNLERDVAIERSPFTARIENYWPDFRIADGKPGTASDAPNNPALVVTLRGRGVPVAAENAGHGIERNPTTGAPLLNAESATQNHLTLFLAADGVVTYELKSRKLGDSSGTLALNQPLVTGWADWQLVVDQTMPHAQRWMDFSPVTSVTAAPTAGDKPDGVRVRVEQNGKTIEQWIPAGWEINIPTSPQPIRLAYGWRAIPLPIAIELREFEVTRNEGSDAPAGFKSTLGLAGVDGRSATGQCWMNNPFSFPNDWWRTWTGLTYKISQASWNPENLNQSTIQILRDPGWSLKWIGSLLIVTGVFLMFYVKKFRRASSAKSTSASVVPRKPSEPAVA